MKPMSHTLGALLVTVFAAAPSAAATTVTAPAPPHTASQITSFLADFYGHHGPTETFRESRISQALRDKQQHSEFDVLLCSQNTPEKIEIGPATVAPAAGIGWATVTTHWGSGPEARTDTFTAYVRLDSRPITLDDVICAG
ncbi:hypothetical protein OG982_01220 [Streptomyces sp. NBC_01551]|uniref:hypothetical protein n=1 Tax=Streptomyces sp. NBC_01551 TaxID=2975876 RepID=UPI002255F77E|nr:hypothetical protein [Streptomyces sp. NBC_01551]MCX4524321.1 hypothetical protein [Streptomyces sp. NBC_01551]